MKKASEVEVVKTSASVSKAGPSKQPVTTTRTSDPTTRASRELRCSTYGHRLLWSFPPTNVYSKCSVRPWLQALGSSTTRILNPSTRNNLKGCVLPELRSTRTRKNTRLGQNTILSHLLQRKISPLSISKSLLSLNRLLLSTTNRITQTQFFTGR